ncbi:Rv2253/PknI dimerization domain-containing protein [Mycolicibacterium setense]
MNGTRAIVVLSAVFSVGVAGAPAVFADEASGDWALNGSYLATSNGDWAQTNDVYKDEPTVRSTWTISMSCSNATTCAGRVTSDAGWSADITAKGSQYIVKHDIPNWEPCPEGNAVTGHQSYMFYPVGDAGYLHPGSRELAGFDKTTGESGGCRLNDKLEIVLPFRLVKAG